MTTRQLQGTVDVAAQEGIMEATRTIKRRGIGFRRGMAVAAVVAMSTLSITLVYPFARGGTPVTAPAAHHTSAPSAALERFQALKEHQAERWLDGVAALAAPVAPTVDHKYTRLKERQAEQVLDRMPVPSSSPVPTTSESYRQRKERQVQAWLDRITAPPAPATVDVDERYRQLKERQAERWLDATTTR